MDIGEKIRSAHRAERRADLLTKIPQGVASLGAGMMMDGEVTGFTSLDMWYFAMKGFTMLGAYYALSRFKRELKPTGEGSLRDRYAGRSRSILALYGAQSIFATYAVHEGLQAIYYGNNPVDMNVLRNCVIGLHAVALTGHAYRRYINGVVAPKLAMELDAE